MLQNLLTKKLVGAKLSLLTDNKGQIVDIDSLIKNTEEWANTVQTCGNSLIAQGFIDAARGLTHLRDELQQLKTLNGVPDALPEVFVGVPDAVTQRYFLVVVRHRTGVLSIAMHTEGNHPSMHAICGYVAKEAGCAIQQCAVINLVEFSNKEDYEEYLSTDPVAVTDDSPREECPPSPDGHPSHEPAEDLLAAELSCTSYIDSLGGEQSDAWQDAPVDGVYIAGFLAGLRHKA